MKSFLGNFYRHLATFIDIWQLFTSHTVRDVLLGQEGLDSDELVLAVEDKDLFVDPAAGDETAVVQTHYNRH